MPGVSTFSEDHPYVPALSCIIKAKVKNDAKEIYNTQHKYIVVVLHFIPMMFSTGSKLYS